MFTIKEISVKFIYELFLLISRYVNASR